MQVNYRKGSRAAEPQWTM